MAERLINKMHKECKTAEAVYSESKVEISESPDHMTERIERLEDLYEHLSVEIAALRSLLTSFLNDSGSDAE